MLSVLRMVIRCRCGVLGLANAERSLTWDEREVNRLAGFSVLVGRKASRSADVLLDGDEVCIQ